MHVRVGVGLKITFGFAAVIILMMVIGGVGSVQHRPDRRHLRGRSDRDRQRRDFDGAGGKGRRAPSGGARQVHRDQRHYYLDEFESAHEIATSTIEELKEAFRDEKGTELAAQMEEAHRTYVELGRPLFTSFYGAYTREFYETTLALDEARHALMTAVQELTAYAEEAMAASRSEAASTRGRSTALMIVIGLVALVVGVALRWGSCGPSPARCCTWRGRRPGFPKAISPWTSSKPVPGMKWEK